MHPDAPASERIDHEALVARLTSAPVLRTGIALAFALLVVLAFGRNANWDEFLFLSHVHSHLDGRLDRPMQTAYVHGFTWLAALPGDEWQALVAARLVMTACLGVTAGALLVIARAVASDRAALVAVFAFLLSGFVLPYGNSFRADPIAAAALMAALAMAMTARMTAMHIVAVAVLSAVALLVTVKSVLYLPAFVGVLIWRWQERGQIVRILVAGCLGLALAGGLFVLHSAGIDAGQGTGAAENLGDAAATTLVENTLLSRWREASLWAALSLGALFLAACGFARAGSLRMLLVLACLAAPLVVSVLFYRNAFAYFFPFIAPPLMVAVAVGFARIGAGAVAGAAVAAIAASGLYQGVRALGEDAALQRATLAEVHRLFPEPVRYIDQASMISSFPSATFFMSTWGVESYRNGAFPTVSASIDTHRPPLLLANRWALYYAMHVPEVEDGPFMLLPEDRARLRETYVHYSGVIWLAGRDVTLTGGDQALSLPFPGTYRLEASGPVVVDGRTLLPGERLHYAAPVELSGDAGRAIRFVWDTGQPPLPDALPDGGVFAGFWLLPF